MFRGINIFEVVKSRKSNIVFEHILNPLNSPNESEAGIAINQTIKNKIKAAFFLVKLKRSVSVAIEASKILMPEVSAAANSNRKNASAKIFP